MAIVPTTEPLVYSGATERLDRFPPVAPTEQLSQKTAPLVLPAPRRYVPYDIAGLLIASVTLIFGAIWLVQRVDSDAFAVLAALLVGGFLWLAFGRDT